MGFGKGVLARLSAPMASGLLLFALPDGALATPIGDLVQLPGTVGCLSEDGFDVPGVNGTSGACADLRTPGAPAPPNPGVDGLQAANDIVTSPDGDHLYVAARGGFLTAYTRDDVTGQIANIAGTGGCKSALAIADCQQMTTSAGTTNLAGAAGVAVSPDGASVYVNTRDSNSVLGFARDAGTGALTPIAGTGGCVRELAPGTTCADGRGLRSGVDVVVTPDGENVYTAAGGNATSGSHAVAVFDRDVTTGAITQKAGTAGCISDTGADFTDAGGSTGVCTDATQSLREPTELAVSPDGAHLYVGTNPNGGVLVFDIQSDGSLTEASCITQTGNGSCEQGRALGAVNSVAVSPDGATVYAGSATANGAVATLDRDPVDGELTQDAGTEGCIAGAGAEGCANGRLLRALGIAVSPDGRSVYVGSANDAVSVLDRDSDGDLSQRPSPAVEECWTELAVAGCSNGRGLSDATAFAFDPEGEFMYVASDQSRAIAAFDRNLDDTADLETDIELDKTEIEQGQAVFVDVTVTNNGPTRADNLVVELTPSGAFEYVASFNGSNCSEAAGKITCSGGTQECGIAWVAPGTPKTCEIYLGVKEAGTFGFDATVSSPGADPVPGNNASQESVEVSPAPPGGATFHVNDLAVAEGIAYTVGGLMKIDPADGSRTTVTSSDVPAGPDIGRSIGVAFDPVGDLYLTADPDTLFHVEPGTGEREIVTDNSFPGDAFSELNQPSDVMVEESGDVLVLSFNGGPDNDGTLVRVDPETGERTLVSAGGSGGRGSGTGLGFPAGLELEPSGDLLVSCYCSAGPGLLRVDLDTGDRTAVSGAGHIDSGPVPVEWAGVELDPDDPNTAYYVDSAGPQILTVDLATGNRTLLSDNSSPGNHTYNYPWGITLDQDGDLIVSDLESIVRVDPDTGRKDVLSGEGAPPGGPALTLPVGIDLRTPVNADLSLSKAGPAQVTGSGQIDYTLVAHNGGPSDATGVKVVDSLPVGFTYDDSASDAACNVGPEADEVTCNLGSMPDGGSDVTFHIRGTAQKNATNLHNSATISWDERDPNSANDTATWDTAVNAAADLSLTMAGPAQVASAGRLDYGLTAHNSGPSDATSVTAVATLAEGAGYDDAASNESCDPGPAAGQVTCTIGTLNSGGADPTLHILANAPAGPGTIRSTAVIAGAESDPDPANNSAGQDTSVDAPPEPEAGETLVAENIEGVVLIRQPDGTYVPLTGKTEIPYGSVIDAEEGSVEIATEGRKGRTRSATFSGAKFEVEDAERGRLTDIILRGGGINSCPVKPIGGRKSKKKKPKRSLFASGGSGHRTTGAYGSATVRGTEWRTIDTCKGTRLLAIEHSIEVEDFVTGETETVREGESYFAKAR